LEHKDEQEYEQKEYKFYIENVSIECPCTSYIKMHIFLFQEGVNGKKILASFNCNIADFAGIPSER